MERRLAGLISGGLFALFDRVALFDRTFVRREGVGNLGAHQDNLRRIVDPDQHHDNRRRGAVGGLQSLLADVKSDGGLSQFEKAGGDDRAEPDIVPVNRGVRQPFGQIGRRRAP
jgi:hypothetical protein